MLTFSINQREKEGRMAGRLEVITGPMYAGKTEELLRRVQRCRIAGKMVVAFKPGIDTRYSPTNIVTHNQRELPCWVLPRDFSFTDLIVRYPEIKKAEVIAFDEAQFFGLQFPEICEGLVEMGKRVIVAGLDLDFKGDPFGPIPNLLALADEVLKLTAVCQKCGNLATRTQRLIGGKPAPKNAPVIQVGGKETYEARCRDCWEKPT